DSGGATMASGATRTTSDGQTIVLAATAVTPDRATATSLGLRPIRESAADCPPGLDCRLVPAAYQQTPSDPGDYGNYDLARREADGPDPRFIVLHRAGTIYANRNQLFQTSLN